MMKLVRYSRTLTLALAIAAIAAPGALAASGCSEKASAIKAGQASAKSMAADRDELLLDVEAAGDAWEDAEVVRNFSASHGARADLARSEYEGLKADLASREEELQTRLASLNNDVANYNRTCATRKR